MSRIHLRVSVGRESYSLPIANVREIAALGDVAPLPGAPSSVLGVLSLHGKVLPVIELSDVLGIPGADRARRIVIAEEGGRLAGLAVYAVSGVETMPDASEAAVSEHLRGAALVDGVLVGAIDVAAIFDAIQAGRAR